MLHYVYEIWSTDYQIVGSLCIIAGDLTHRNRREVDEIVKELEPGTFANYLATKVIK